MKLRRGEGTISGAVIVLGALAMTVVIILVAWNLTGKMRYPSPDKRYLNGTEEQVGSFIARHMNKCWEEHNYGTSPAKEEDCILLKVRSSRNLTSDDIKKHLGYTALKERLNFTWIPADFNASLKIVYRGRKGKVEVRKFY